MILALHILQVLTILTCCYPAYLFAADAWCWMRGKCEGRMLPAATFFVAVVSAAFPLRWLIDGNGIDDVPCATLAIWCALYGLAIMAIIALTIAVREAISGNV